VQPGLKNLTDHFFEAGFGRPGAISGYFGEPTGDGGAALVKAFPRCADDLAWWPNAARLQRAKVAPPY
jgi:hypothetical protein